MTRKETQRTERVGLTHGNVPTLCQEEKGDEDFRMALQDLCGGER